MSRLRSGNWCLRGACSGAYMDVERKSLEEISQLDPSKGNSLAHLLPNDPDKIIVSLAPPNAQRLSPRARRNGRFLPRDYYEFDLKKRTKKLILQGKITLGGFFFDSEGNARGARGVDVGEREFVWYWRAAGGKDWKEFYRMPLDDFEFNPFQVAGIDDAQPNHIFVIARNGHDKLGLWSFDVEKKAFAELVFRHPEVDVDGVVGHSNFYQHPDKIVGAAYYYDKPRRAFFADDGGEQALRQQLEGLIPHAFWVGIASRSRDGATMVVTNQGPRDPGTYYLIKNGALKTIGSQQPLLKSDDLADVEFITYKARDGMKMPAYLTVPPGDEEAAPRPLVVMPHGGPFARDRPRYDKWAQLLANQGYLVVQPQFRGSTGFGLAHEMASYDDGGQWGRKMQDDKDDAALHLVELGLADRDRIAMFGWSYGGYAAAVAASRTPQIYQCVVAGAAVLDPVMQLNQYRWGLQGEVRERVVAMAESAVSPVKEVANINVPMLIVHGDVDSRVRIEHAKDYLNAIKGESKDVSYVELKGAAHFYNTLRYDHQREFFTAMVDFLANDCGPDGL